MDYTIKAMETVFKDVLFRSRLEAKWAAMFDICGWRWQYEPVDLPGWSPDFYLDITRRRRGGGNRDIKLLVEVKPYTNYRQFDGHPCELSALGRSDFECEACVGLGISPECCLILLESDGEGSHGQCDFNYLVSVENNFSMSDVMSLWRRACNSVQWKYSDKGRRLS